MPDGRLIRLRGSYSRTWTPRESDCHLPSATLSPESVTNVLQGGLLRAYDTASRSLSGFRHLVNQKGGRDQRVRSESRETSCGRQKKSAHEF